jgi:carbamoyl-phosphate synthase small subunit
VPEVWSNWRGTESLDHFLKRHRLVGITGIDTRELIHHLQEKGAQTGCISTASSVSEDELVKKARVFPGMDGKDLAAVVSTPERYILNANGSLFIIVYDFGVKKHILDILVNFGARVIVVPAKTPVQDVLSQSPDGILLSNGPGDPNACDYAIAAIQVLMQKNIPLLGICLGFQLMALAAGARTYKMKFGHHGANHPVSCVEEGNRVMITSQNHGFAVDEKTLPLDFCVTHRSLFDQSLQGFRHRHKPFFGFQGHPEASPGPQEADELFEYFFTSMSALKETI